MTEIILDCLIDALKDGALSIPILFVAYLLMEMLENSKRLDENMLQAYSRKAGPLIGGLLGVVPQCGISGAAATLFSTGTVSIGTMLAVFFATSDEMLPVMLSSMSNKSTITLPLIASIVISKAVLGIALGYLVDALAGRFFRRGKDIHSFCEREHCECDEEGSVVVSALLHTLKIAVMLIGVNLILNILFETVGVEKLSGTVFAAPVIGEIMLALFGLIPNCSVSVIMTEAYISGMIELGGLFAGLLSNAGIGLLVLFRTNKDIKENLIVLALLFILGAFSGIVINLFI